MSEAIAHRGPDDEGFWHGPGVGLAARRLSIIDVEGSQQPQFGPSGRTVCVFNGEIYNFAALRAELEAAGHCFQTQGDTEVLPHGYERWGMEGLLRRLNGMFAFAIFDARSEELFLARDRLGIKPLYVGSFDGTWIFGSEIKALLRHPAARREVSLPALSRYLLMEYVPSPHSIYSGIKKLPAAHYQRIGPAGESSLHRYWSLSWRKDRDEWPHPEIPLPAAGDDSEQAWSEALLHALRAAVQDRLVSEVPIGALLSGGVDSSTTAALMAEQVPDLRTFSIAFDEGSFDERRWSRAVAERIGSRHCERIFDAGQFQPILADVLSHMDEPFADGSLLPTSFLSRVVKEEGVTVALSGDGADELFAGYPTYLAQRGAVLAGLMPGGRSLLRQLRRIADRLPASFGDISLDYRIKRFLAGASLPPARRQISWHGAFLDEELRGLLQPGIAEQLRPSDPWVEVDATYAEPQQADRLERLLHLDLRGYMGDDILVKVDRASMQRSLEVRVPFLDHRLVELAARMPPGLKLKGRTGKHLLKKAVAPLLPAGITERRKKGFGMPVAKWLRGPWRELLLDTLSGGRAASTGWFDQGAVDRLIADHLSGRADRRKQLWALLVFRRWEEGAYGP